MDGNDTGPWAHTASLDRCYPTVNYILLPRWRCTRRDDLKLEFSGTESSLSAWTRCLSWKGLWTIFSDSRQHKPRPYSAILRRLSKLWNRANFAVIAASLTTLETSEQIYARWGLQCPFSAPNHVSATGRSYNAWPLWTAWNLRSMTDLGSERLAFEHTSGIQS